VIFHQRWLEEIILCWEKQPEYWMICPWGFYVKNYPCCKQDLRSKREVIACGHPGAVTVFKRSTGWQWDEQFPLWELDADMVCHSQKNQLKMGLCLSSRVDHLVTAVNPLIDMQAHYGPQKGTMGATELLRKKWGLE
jgi:hypothetical protein